MTLRDLIARPEWVEDAACRGAPVDIFYPDHRGNTPLAVQFCRTCDVQAQCLAHALNTREEGTWGGLSEIQRRRVLRRIAEGRTVA